jgi:hypothetical protein
LDDLSQDEVEAANTLISALKRPATISRLSAAYHWPEQNRELLETLLADIEQRSRETLQSRASGDRLSGGVLSCSPMLICAAFTAELLCRIDGACPSASSKRAAEVADAIWNVYRLKRRRSWGNNGYTAWKRYFRQIDDTRLADFRREIRRQLMMYLSNNISTD